MDTAVFLNPITGKMEVMPVAMIGAYVPHAEHLRLEEAARVAAIRDDEAATNLLLSVIDIQCPEILVTPEGCQSDRLAVESPSLR